MIDLEEDDIFGRSGNVSRARSQERMNNLATLAYERKAKYHAGYSDGKFDGMCIAHGLVMKLCPQMSEYEIDTMIADAFNTSRSVVNRSDRDAFKKMMWGD